MSLPDGHPACATRASVSRVYILSHYDTLLSLMRRAPGQYR